MLSAVRTAVSFVYLLLKTLFPDQLIVFQLSRQNVEKLLVGSGLSQTPADVFGLYLNLQYDGSHVTCTTGTSLRTFTMDKSLDRVWDEMVTKFFKQQQIPVLLV